MNKGFTGGQIEEGSTENSGSNSRKGIPDGTGGLPYGVREGEGLVSW